MHSHHLHSSSAAVASSMVSFSLTFFARHLLNSYHRMRPAGPDSAEMRAEQRNLANQRAVRNNMARDARRIAVEVRSCPFAFFGFLFDAIALHATDSAH